MDSFSNEELSVEYRRARFMGEIAEGAGEADAAALFASIQRACEYEMRERKMPLT